MFINGLAGERNAQRVRAGRRRRLRTVPHMAVRIATIAVISVAMMETSRLLTTP